ncbi:MAG: hypothetical protein WCI75_10290, partial [candidate division NC10 bacterium]
MKLLMALLLGLSFCVFHVFPVFAEDTAEKTATEAVAFSPEAPSAPTNNNTEETSAKVPASEASVSSPEAPPSASAPVAADPQSAPKIEKTVVAMDVRGNRIVSTNTILS